MIVPAGAYLCSLAKLQGRMTGYDNGGMIGSIYSLSPYMARGLQYCEHCVHAKRIITDTTSVFNLTLTLHKV